MNDNDIVLRQATWEDFGFLWQVHRTALKDYVARTWGWDEEWQERHFRQHFSPASRQIIRFRECDAGVLSVERDGPTLFLANIALLPAFQRRGIGTAIIRAILEEARGLGKPVLLQVLKVNPARRLYERLGFVIIDESETHYIMQATP